MQSPFALSFLFVDLPQAIRSLRKNPAYALTVVLTLSLAIGANSTIFTLASAFLLSHLPVVHPEHLFQVVTVDPESGKRNLSISAFQGLQANTSVFSSILAWNGGGVENFEMNGMHFVGSVDEVVGDYYATLGVQPAIGRFFTKQDIGLEHYTPSRVAVIGYHIWQDRFGGDPSVIGKTLLINGGPFTIIGVHPKSFPGLIREIAADVTVPTTAYASSAERLYDRNSDFNTVIGRLRDGISEREAEAQLKSLWPAIRLAAAPQKNPEFGLFLRRGIQLQPAATGISYLRERFTQPLHILLGIVGLLLLLACVNLATLALARAQSQAAEYSLRAALGARPPRLLLVGLTESLLLAVCGVLPGLAFAYAGSKYLGQFMWRGLVPLAISLEPDGRIMLFTTAIAGIAAVLFGGLPSWRNAHQEPGRAFQSASLRMSQSLGFSGRALVTLQIALSFSIVAIALLFSRSLDNVLRADPGFTPNRLLVATLFPRTTYRGFDKPAYFRHLLETLREIPGVSAASIAHMRPIQMAWKAKISPGNIESNYHLIAPDFFNTLGMRILRGRDFVVSDDEHHPLVAIVSENLAQRLLPAGDAIGKFVEIGDLKGSFQAIGVASNATLDDPRVEKSPAVYADIFQRPDYLGQPEAIIRTSGNPARLSEVLRKRIEGLGREHTLRIGTATEEYELALTPERMVSLLTGFFGAVGLLLAAVGIYGLLSYAAARRASEFGIRMALGAERHHIVRLVVRELGPLLIIGLAVGLFLTLAGTRAVSIVLFGLSRNDPATLAITASLLVAVASAAAAVPAVRATRVDPANSLRSN